MDAESIRQYCLRKKAVTESFPFGDNALVFKVKEKMFLLLMLNLSPAEFNAKCDPDEAVELREQYPSIRQGYHMNKRLWNTITADSSIPVKLIKKLIDDSYTLVVKSLSKKAQEGLISG